MNVFFWIMFFVAVGLGIANIVLSIRKKRMKRNEKKKITYQVPEDIN